MTVDVHIKGNEALIEEVAENLFKIRLPMPFDLKHINVYLIKENDRLGLVDCGLNMDESWEVLTSAFDSLNLQMSDLTDMFLTHSHPDHVGALRRVRTAAPEARVYIHRRELALMNRFRDNFTQAEAQAHEWLTSAGATDLEASGMAGHNGGSIRPPKISEHDHIMEGGEVVNLGGAAETEVGAGWQVIWTPGHTAGHFVLYHTTRRLLLSGDHLLPTITSNIGKYPGSTDDPLGDFYNSLDKMAALDITEVMPAHGGRFTTYRERIITIKEHHRERTNKILTCLEQGPQSVRDVRSYIWPYELRGFNQYLALMEALSHLQRLFLEGRVTIERNHAGVDYYSLA